MTPSVTQLLTDLDRAAPVALPLILLLLKITCLLGIARLVTLALERASAGVRHLVWLVALGALMALPAVAAWSPLPLPVLPQLAATESAFQGSSGSDEPSAPAGTTTPTVLPRQDAPLPPPGESRASTPTAKPGAGSLLIALWALVAAALLVRLALGAWAVRRIVRRAVALDDAAWQGTLYEVADRMGLEQAPRLVRSAEVQMPFAAGLLAPVVVLPAESESWSPARRTAVLIHELAHIRRRDLAGHTLGRVVCALYWFHPLVWTAARRLRAESERACDDLALRFGARPSEYAEHLLDIVTAVRHSVTPAIALAMAHPREFEGRMLAILNPDLERRGPSRGQSVTVVGALAGVMLLVGAAVPVPRPQAVPTPAAPVTVPAPVSGPDTAHSQTVAVPATPAVRPVPSAQSRAMAAPVTARQETTRTVTSEVEHQVEAMVAREGGEDDRPAVLARLLRTDSSGEVRRVAAWGLARYARLDAAAQALVAALAGDRDSTVREMAAWALGGARRNPVVGTALARAIREERDPEVRTAAIWAAGSVGDPGALDALVGALKTADGEQLEVALWAIGSLRPEKVPAPVTAALSHASSDVREAAAWVFYVVRDPETVDVLDTAFRREKDADVQEGLLKALAMLGERATPTLERMLTSEDERVRRTAVTALAGGDAGGPWPWPWPWPRPYP